MNNMFHIKLLLEILSQRGFCRVHNYCSAGLSYDDLMMMTEALSCGGPVNSSWGQCIVADCHECYNLWLLTMLMLLALYNNTLLQLTAWESILSISSQRGYVLVPWLLPIPVYCLSL